MQQTIQIGQVQPATFLKWKESESNAKKVAGNAIFLKMGGVKRFIARTVGGCCGTATYPTVAGAVAKGRTVAGVAAKGWTVAGGAAKGRTVAGGVALMGGMVLASGADTLAQALLTLAAFLVAGACFHEEGEEGGEV